ncbi:hypothetical protein [Ferrimonas senticii]|uniref:hypothetical protein n=1 Tax=Ferrimonas senticii TaxID=394566 RepID=UPI00042624CE|nr:hypothetical protein [Ferrimonas senticii]
MTDPKPISSTTVPSARFDLSRGLSLGLLLLCLGWLAEVYLKNHQFPMSSTLMLLLIGALMLLLSGQLSLSASGVSRQYRYGCSAAALVLLALASRYSAPDEASSVLTYLWAQLFFLSRPLTLGLVLAAAIGYLLLIKQRDQRLQIHCHLLALLAGLAFMCGEVAGSYWAMQGWGRTWSWSSHFFFSALFYLLLILVFHFPRQWLRSQKQLNLAKALLLLFIALLQVGYRIK